jgi:Protein of unknown function (DUF1566)
VIPATIRGSWPISGLVAAAMLLGGCEQEAPPGPDIQDTKYAMVGADGLPIDADRAGSDGQSWPCVLDQFTGLTWEAKADEPGLHDWRNTYSWYEPDEPVEPVDYRGTPDGGECVDSACDTHDFVRAVNAAGYCGFDDWRMPTRDELASITDLRKVESPPTINLQYFPYAQSEEYWSGNDYSFQYDGAWAWSFRYGHDRVDWKREPKALRLVRGEALNLQQVED